MITNIDECILCHHKLDVHKVTSYNNKHDSDITYSIRCRNDDGVEGYKHCDCNLGFESVNYIIKVEKCV